jgi:hypothetical protein
MQLKDIHEANRQKFLQFCQNHAKEIDPINFNYDLFVRKLAADGLSPDVVFNDYHLSGAYVKLRSGNLLKLKVAPPPPKLGTRDERLYNLGIDQTQRGYSPLQQNRDEQAAKEQRQKEQAEASIKQAEKNREKTLARIERHQAWVTSNRVGQVQTATEKAAMKAELEAGWPGNQGLIDFSKWQSL